MGMIVHYLSGSPLRCCIVYAGQVFLFVTNHLASCVDNTSKFILFLPRRRLNIAASYPFIVHLGEDTLGARNWYKMLVQRLYSTDHIENIADMHGHQEMTTKIVIKK